MTAVAEREWPRPILVAARLVSAAIIVAALYFGQVILLPLALAAFVTFLLGPVVTRLDRVGLPRIVSVIVVAGAFTGMIGGLGYVVVGELGELADELPAYRQNIRSKLADLREMTRGGTLERVQTTIEDITEDVESDTEAEERARGAGESEPQAAQDREPVPVQIEEDSSVMRGPELLGPVADVAATIGLTMLLSIFMLIKREDLRNRIVSLAGQASLVVTTRAFAEAGQRITRYLLMQFIINATMGIAVGVGLFLIGVPYAALWGLSAAVLRYIPYVGPWAAALLPISVSVITAPGWEQVVMVVGLIVILELFSNNVMEPWLYGQSVGLSTIAVIVSAIFWTWLWGPIGLIIATPMTACLVVLSRYIPELAVLDRLLSEGPALQPHLSLYQRLLARDEEEAEDIVESYLDEHSLDETCDMLLLATLVALKRDLANGRVASNDGDFVASAIREIIDDLPRPTDEEKLDGAAAEAGEAQEYSPRLVIGFPVRDKLDEIALELLGAMLPSSSCELVILSPDQLIGERIAAVGDRQPLAVCVASLPPGDLTATRHVCKRLRARMPKLVVLAARLVSSGGPTRSSDVLRAAGAKEVATSLRELRDALSRVDREARIASGGEMRPDSELAAAR